MRSRPGPLWLFTACILFCCHQPRVSAQDLDPCPELLRNESNLDYVYERSRMVFVAAISPRGGPNPHIYNIRRIDPVIKGEVPEAGYVTFADECRPVDDEAIYLFLLDSMQEKIADANAVFFSLTPEGPGYSWIAEWIRGKLGRGLEAVQSE